jgi:hypothetical protein
LLTVCGRCGTVNPDNDPSLHVNLLFPAISRMQ